MNDFTRKGMQLAEAYANQVAAFIASKPHNMEEARSAFLTHLEGGEQKPSLTISHTEIVSAPDAALKVEVIHLTEEGKRAMGYLPATPTEDESK